MRKDKESGKFMVFKCILPGFNPGFEHLYVHKFPLDQYASLVFLFALVKKKKTQTMARKKWERDE